MWFPPGPQLWDRKSTKSSRSSLHRSSSASRPDHTPNQAVSRAGPLSARLHPHPATCPPARSETQTTSRAHMGGRRGSLPPRPSSRPARRHDLLRAGPDADLQICRGIRAGLERSACCSARSSRSRAVPLPGGRADFLEDESPPRLALCDRRVPDMDGWAWAPTLGPRLILGGGW